MHNRTFILLSPVAIVGIGAIVIRIAEPSLGVWAWVPWILVYWTMLLALVLVGGGTHSIRRWMAAPRGSWLWSALAILLALPALTVFVGSVHLLRPFQVWLPWLIVGLVNPFLEEWYWRGLLLDASESWPLLLALVYTSIPFSLNHLLGIGVTSVGLRQPLFLLNTFILAMVFGLIYKKTRSLRWLVVSHMLSDLLGLSVPVFLNIWSPPF
jgi:membrane protease YdiL (CAAX protease family)